LGSGNILIITYYASPFCLVQRENVFTYFSLNSGPLAKGRFTNMRTTFQQYHRKVENSKRSGTSSDDVYVPKWKLYHKLEFLKKTNAQANGLSNIANSFTTPRVFSAIPEDVTFGNEGAISNNP